MSQTIRINTTHAHVPAVAVANVGLEIRGPRTSLLRSPTKSGKSSNANQCNAPSQCFNKREFVMYIQ